VAVFMRKPSGSPRAIGLPSISTATSSSVRFVDAL
jgi:hypothetical protein